MAAKHAAVRWIMRLPLAILTLLALFAGALLVGPPGASWAQEKLQKRIALVIGNSHYASAQIRDLSNPVNDAADVAQMLSGFGFEVQLERDLGKAAMSAAMSSFGQAAKDADVALFYYGGHGLQLDLRNYLAPVDAVYRTHADVISNSVPLDALTGAAEGMSGALLVFLDACQENPTGGRDGLARIPVARNQYFALAALPDNLAADGTGRNSPFTAAFLANAGIPGRTISDVMLGVRQDVIAATGSQVPWDNSSLTERVELVPGEAETLPAETLLWRTASSLGDPELVRTYIERFPEGAHVEDARLLLASGRETTAPIPDADLQRQKNELWRIASSSRWRPLMEAYLERFPDGEHANEARSLIAVLPDPTDPGGQPATFICELLTTHPNDETAAFAGVSAERLSQNVQAAIQACRTAHRDFPTVHKYTAMLARALSIGGNLAEAITLFEEAAKQGNVRAMTTLGLLYERGTGVRKDLATAAQYYQQAADLEATDAAVNLARLWVDGIGGPPDVPRAVGLLTRASDAGSRQAAYNLGVLAVQGKGVPSEMARTYLALASDRGFVKASLLAAGVYEIDKYGPSDHKRAAEFIVRAIASDSGDALAQMETGKVGFGVDTIREVQVRLSEGGYYKGALDGQLGPQTLQALRFYRFGGLKPLRG